MESLGEWELAEAIQRAADLQLNSKELRALLVGEG
jgi:hypothetical protein